ncbi:MAG: WXG100 family type VII secretion target [Phycisphaerae bacterium]|nr:WXG100 family type VII secretion target [Phycisphaerae bacterium]
MAKAHVNPEELRRFARELNRFNGELDSLMGRIHMKMVNLEKSWQDQEQKKFSEEFGQTMKVLARFLETSTRHCSVLGKKAKHIEDYLNS